MSGAKKHPSTNPMGRPEHWTVERIAKLQESLWNHVTDPESHDILGWRGKERLTRQMVTHICDKSEDFRSAYEAAKATLGSVRQKKALTGAWNAGTVKRDDWNYDKDLLEHDKEMRLDPNDTAMTPAQRAAKSLDAKGDN